MNQNKTPLYDALHKHHESQSLSYHVPGHKFGVVFPERGRQHYHSILRLDATEITGLDDLHNPDGVINEAQNLLADYYQVQNSYFLVNGSTSGNLAMILTACSENDYVLVQRNCHKSILHGLKLAGVKPIFIAPEYDDDIQLPTVLTFERIQQALHHYPKIKAIILTYPSYFGIANDLSTIIDYIHNKDIPVLVDEAHGAHFRLGDPFPKSAVEYGADIVVQSAHKTLPAMTMGSYLHLNSSRIDRDKLEYYLQVVQSSSPSYSIMASLDLARYYLATFNIEELSILKTHVQKFISKLQAISQIDVVSAQKGQFEMDLLKVTIQSRCSLSGFEIQKSLEMQGIYTELATPNHVLFILSLQNKEEELLLVANQVKEIVKDLKPVKGILIENDNWMQPIAEFASFSDLKNYQKKVVSLHEAVGQIAAQEVTPYPPGIPFIMAGEIINDSHISTLFLLKQKGTRFQAGTGIFEKGIEVFQR